MMDKQSDVDLAAHDRMKSRHRNLESCPHQLFESLLSTSANHGFGGLI